MKNEENADIKLPNTTNVTSQEITNLTIGELKYVLSQTKCDHTLGKEYMRKRWNF